MNFTLHFSFARLLFGLSWQRVNLVRQDSPTRPLRELRIWTLEIALGPLLVVVSQKPKDEVPMDFPQAPIFPYNGPIQRR